MKNIRLKKGYNHHFENYGDIEKIIEAMARAGYRCTPEQAVMLWEEYSEAVCAGWLGLPDSEEIVGCVRCYFEVEGEEEKEEEAEEEW